MHKFTLTKVVYLYIQIVFWHLQTHLYATAAHVDLENQSQLICLQRITVKAVIQYNNENSLSSVLAIAYLCAMQYYFKPIRELPTGRGFSDFVFIPKPEYQNEYPALIVELKWNRNAQTAMQQIKDRNYPASILSYTGDILLVAINYDKSSKEHQCQIEQYQKE